MTYSDSASSTFVWGPTIDEAACTDCRVCLDFCTLGVYGIVDDHVRVVSKGSCVEGCSHCAGMCAAEALSFPTIDELRAAKRKA